MSGCLLKFPGQAEVSPVLHFSRYEHLDVDEQIPLRAELRDRRTRPVTPVQDVARSIAFARPCDRRGADSAQAPVRPRDRAPDLGALRGQRFFRSFLSRCARRRGSNRGPGTTTRPSC
jgi:hypothetical protein